MADDSLYGSDFRRRPPYHNRIAHLLPPTGYDGTAEADLQSALTPLTEVLSAQLAERPRALVVALDLVNSLAPAFMPAAGGSPYEQNHALQGGDAAGPFAYRVLDRPDLDVVVAVKYNTVNVGHFLSVLPTNREITFDALVVHHADGSVSRYIDWNFVMAQLGIIGSQRPTLGVLDPATQTIGPRPDDVTFSVIDDRLLRETSEPDPDRQRPLRRLLRWLLRRA